MPMEKTSTKKKPDFFYLDDNEIKHWISQDKFRG